LARDKWQPKRRQGHRTRSRKGEPLGSGCATGNGGGPNLFGLAGRGASPERSMKRAFLTAVVLALLGPFLAGCGPARQAGAGYCPPPLRVDFTGYCIWDDRGQD